VRGLFALQNGFEYCSNHDRSAISYVFDQCSWICNPIYDNNDPNFKANFKANILFSDGAAGVLMIPGSMKQNFDRPLMKVIDINTKFFPGDEITMIGNRFSGRE